jgi:hypothetical protein
LYDHTLCDAYIKSYIRVSVSSFQQIIISAD